MLGYIRNCDRKWFHRAKLNQGCMSCWRWKSCSLDSKLLQILASRIWSSQTICWPLPLSFCPSLPLCFLLFFCSLPLIRSSMYVILSFSPILSICKSPPILFYLTWKSFMILFSRTFFFPSFLLGLCLPLPFVPVSSLQQAVRLPCVEWNAEGKRSKSRAAY